MTSRGLAYEHDIDGDSSDGFTPDTLLTGIDLEQTLLDDLHALKYGEQPRGLGWAWREAEQVAPTTVRINGTPHTFNPLTRSLAKHEC